MCQKSKEIVKKPVIYCQVVQKYSKQSMPRWFVAFVFRNSGNVGLYCTSGIYLTFYMYCIQILTIGINYQTGSGILKLKFFHETCAKQLIANNLNFVPSVNHFTYSFTISKIYSGL